MSFVQTHMTHQGTCIYLDEFQTKNDGMLKVMEPLHGIPWLVPMLLGS